MNSTLQRNNYSPDSITTPDDHTIEFPESKTYTIPIVIQEKPTYADSYFIDISDSTYDDGRPFIVYECTGFIAINRYSFKTMKEAVDFIKTKGGI